MPCKCSLKSKCGTRLCACKLAKQHCVPECTCLKGFCGNMISDSVPNSVAEPHNNTLAANVSAFIAVHAKSSKPKWCKCGCCQETLRQKPIEKHCCRKLKGPCVVEDDDLQTVVLHAAVVQASINSQRLLLAQATHSGYENRSMRHQAYGQYIAHCVGAMGAGKRIVVPACVVAAIRNKWPAPDDFYTGFKKSTLNGHREFTFTVDGGRQPLDISDDDA